MFRIKKQTHEEKIAMYMKSTKKELIEMLIECNRIMRLIRDRRDMKAKDVIQDRINNMMNIMDKSDTLFSDYCDLQGKIDQLEWVLEDENAKNNQH